MTSAAARTWTTCWSSRGRCERRARGQRGTSEKCYMIAGRTTESQNKCCGQAEAGSDDDPDKEPLSLLFAIDARTLLLFAAFAHLGVARDHDLVANPPGPTAIGRQPRTEPREECWDGLPV